MLVSVPPCYATLRLVQGLSCFFWDPYPTRPLARTRGSSTKCSERNQTCISFVRITSLTSKSFVPSSPASTACLAIVRDSNRMTSCAWSSRDSCTGTSRSEEHTSELQSPCNLVCRLLLEKKKKTRLHRQ